MRSKRLDRVTEEIVANIERLYHIDLGQARTELVEHLKAHLIPTIYRIRYHKAIVNPLYDELVAKHGQLLRYTAEAVKPLEECCEGPISDQEVSYIALYFLAAIDQQHPQVIHRPRVVVACGSGYGTAQVVASQMSRLFDVDVVAVLSGRDVSELMEKRDIQCDYIVSTVDLPRLPDGLYIKVNPIFTHKDYKNILQFMDARQTGGSASRYLETADTLLEIARRYGADRNLNQMKYEFLSAMTSCLRLSNAYRRPGPSTGLEGPAAAASDADGCLLSELAGGRRRQHGGFGGTRLCDGGIPGCDRPQYPGVRPRDGHVPRDADLPCRTGRRM